jgi:hypothetical protein
VENELVTPQTARDVYKVAIDAKTLMVDQEATRRLRTK